MPELSLESKKLLHEYKVWHQEKDRKHEQVIAVDEIASKLARLYETIRSILDWHEEHLLRKQAIERILKRRLLLTPEGSKIALPIIQELIRGGYFENKAIPQSKIALVEAVIEKQLKLSEGLSGQKTKDDPWRHSLILPLAALEIEDILSPNTRQDGLAELMSDYVGKRINFSPEGRDKNYSDNPSFKTQLFIGVQRALFKFEDSMVVYNLLKFKFPSWKSNTPESIQWWQENIRNVLRELRRELNNPLAGKLKILCRKKGLAFLLLDDILRENPQEAETKINNPSWVEHEVKKAYQKRLRRLKGQLRRAAVYSTISIFASKMLLAIILEIPIDAYLTGQTNFMNLGFTIALPPLLMLLLVVSTSLPHPVNARLAALEVIKILYPAKERESFKLDLDPTKGGFLKVLVPIFYVFLFLLTFFLLGWLLFEMKFGLFSIIVFLMFISLISFAGIRIRERAAELKIMEQKEGVLGFLLQTFSIPMLHAGKWLSEKFSRYNILIFFDLLIEIPIKVLVEFVEEWRYFLKRQRERMR